MLGKIYQFMLSDVLAFFAKVGQGMKRQWFWIMVCLAVPVAGALAAAGSAAAEDKVGYLSERLKDSSFKVRLKAAVLLGRMSDERAVTPLCDALKDENYVVRGAAARALGNLGYPTAVVAVDPLMKLLKDEELFVRKEVMQALERLSGSQSLDLFISALSHEEPVIRLTVLHILASMKLPEARAAIIPLLGDADEEVKSEAVLAIKGFGQAELETLLQQALGKKENYQVQISAVRLAAEMKLAATMNTITDLLVSDEIVPEVKKEASKALTSMKEAIDVPSLIAQLSSSDRSSQDRAIKLLGLHGGNQAVDALLGLLNHTDPFVRRQAVFALGDAEDPRAIPAIESLLKKEDNPRFRELIQRTLRKLKP
jgi:HEAT repeat protein